MLVRHASDFTNDAQGTSQLASYALQRQEDVIILPTPRRHPRQRHPEPAAVAITKIAL